MYGIRLTSKIKPDASFYTQGSSKEVSFREEDLQLVPGSLLCVYRGRLCIVRVDTSASSLLSEFESDLYDENLAFCKVCNMHHGSESSDDDDGELAFDQACKRRHCHVRGEILRMGATLEE